MKTNYIVVPFSTGRGGKLAPGVPQTAKSSRQALAMGERLATSRAGVAVPEEQSDKDNDVNAEPRLLAHFGRIPEEMLEALEAA